MSALPRDASGRRQAFFADDGIDQLVSMVLELSAELWTVRERLYVLEAAATAHDLPLRQYVENYRLSPAETAELAEMRKRMLTETFRTLNREHRPAREAAQDLEQE